MTSQTWSANASNYLHGWVRQTIWRVIISLENAVLQHLYLNSLDPSHQLLYCFGIYLFKLQRCSRDLSFIRSAHSLEEKRKFIQKRRVFVDNFFFRKAFLSISFITSEIRHCEYRVSYLNRSLKVIVFLAIYRVFVK